MGLRIMVNKKPTGSRFFCHRANRTILFELVWGALVAAVLGSSHPAHAQTPRLLSEADAIRSALERPEIADLVEAEKTRLQANAMARGVWANPEIAYEREQLPGDELEQALVISQSIDISGRRGLWRRAAEQHSQAAQLLSEASRVRIAADIRARFHAVLYRQTRVQIAGERLARLERALAVVDKRLVAGDASAYEQQRLGRELATARIERERETLARDRAWTRLATLIDVPTPSSWPRVTGRLLPASSIVTDSGDREMDRMVANRPDVRALDATLSALTLEERTSARGWIPRIGVSLGWRSVASADDTRHGFVAGLTVSVPIFARGHWRGEIARSRQRRAAAEKSLLIREASSTLAVTSAQTQRLIATAVQFREDSERAAKTLVRTAEVGYAGGELGLLELLDAYRSATDDALRVAELEYAARTVSIEMIAALGKETL